MSCADLAYLVFLPSGDETRRGAVAILHSRQFVCSLELFLQSLRAPRGILVEEDAPARAEAGVSRDADARARARDRRAEREAGVSTCSTGASFVRLHSAISTPRVLELERFAIAEHACRKIGASWTVGESQALR